VPHPKNYIQAGDNAVSDVYTNGYVSVLKLCSPIRPNKPYDLEKIASYDTEKSATLLYLRSGQYLNRTATVQTDTYCIEQAAPLGPTFIFDSSTTTCTEFSGSVNCDVSHEFFLL